MIEKYQRIYIRPGSSTREVLEEFKGYYYGLHASVTMQHYMADFVGNCSIPFIADPCTYIFTLPAETHLNKNNKLKKNILEMSTAYGNIFTQTVGQTSIQPWQINNSNGQISEIIKNVIDYQKQIFSGHDKLFNPDYEKYSIYYDKPASMDPVYSVPEILFAPYFLINEVGDYWYDLNLKIAQEVQNLQKQSTEDLFPVICIEPKVLGDELKLGKLIEDFGKLKVKGYFIWIDGWKEEKTKEDRLLNYVKLVVGLSKAGKKLIKMYGGYFSMLLFQFGLTGITCGPGYGDSKSTMFFSFKGKKPFQPKYYVPKLHRAIEFADAESILRTEKKLWCDCPICKKIYNADINKFNLMMNDKNSEKHFLHIRKDEWKEIGDQPLEGILKNLEKTISEFDNDTIINTKNLLHWKRTIDKVVNT
jgi:hypothetical protein